MLHVNFIHFIGYYKFNFYVYKNARAYVIVVLEKYTLNLSKPMQVNLLKSRLSTLCKYCVEKLSQHKIK